MIVKTTFFAVLITFAFVSQTKGQYQVRGISNLEERKLTPVSPSPEGYAFAKYISNPIGYYTGTPKITVPLYEYKDHDLVMPISLSYHAGGIRVEEAASNVGLGWSLMAGGMITRVVKDAADDASVNNWTGAASSPPIDGFTRNPAGLLWAKTIPANESFKGTNTYDIELSGYNGLWDTPTHSKNLLQKFFGVVDRTGPSVKEVFLLRRLDKEPDIFYYNFMGYAGSFVFDVSGPSPVARQIPYDNLAIEYTATPNGAITEFRIKDKFGVLYIFNHIERTTTNIQANSDYLDLGLLGLGHEVKSYDTGNGNSEFTSGWYLSRVETPLGKFLNFTYVDEDHTLSFRGPQQTSLSDTGFPASLLYDPNDTENFQYYNSLKRNSNRTQGKRLVRIENNEIQIDFNSNHIRQDLETTAGGCGAITEIVVTNKIGTPSRIKKFALNYDYFRSDPSEVINEDLGLRSSLFEIDVENTSIYYKRLRLRSVQEFGTNDSNFLPATTFEYKDVDYTGISWHRLPHRLSFQQDIWGFYNAASGNRTLIPAIWVYPSHFPVKDHRRFRINKLITFSGPQYLLKGANRTTNLNTFDMGMLTKVTYPSGGYTQYNYSSHEYYDGNQNILGGGARISTIIKHDGRSHSNDITYNYDYNLFGGISSGDIMSEPVFAIRNINPKVGNFPNDDSEESYATATTRFSLTQAPMGQTNGSYVGYRRVTEYISGNGRVERNYSLPASRNKGNDTNGSECNVLTDGICDDLYRATQIKDIVYVSETSTDNNLANYDFVQDPAVINSFPFPDNPNYDWQRGHLMKESVYDEGNNLLTETINSYNNYFPGSATEPVPVYGYKISHHYPLLNTGFSPSAFLFRVAKYGLLTDMTKVLASQTVRTRSQVNSTEEIVTITTNAYQSGTVPLATKSLVENSDGLQYETVSDFAADLGSTILGSDILRGKHMNAVELRRSSFINEIAEAKVESTFDFVNGLPVEVQKETFPTSGAEPIRVDFEYDNAANVAEQTRVGGVSVAYVHGYNKMYVVAEIKGATQADVQSAFGGVIPDLLGGGLSPAQETQLRSWMEINVPIAQVTTFQYTPMVGLKSATDANGFTLNYEYDALNRLKTIRDTNGNILQSYVYRYQVKDNFQNGN